MQGKHELYHIICAVFSLCPRVRVSAATITQATRSLMFQASQKLSPSHKTAEPSTQTARTPMGETKINQARAGLPPRSITLHTKKYRKVKTTQKITGLTTVLIFRFRRFPRTLCEGWRPAGGTATATSRLGVSRGTSTARKMSSGTELLSGYRRSQRALHYISRDKLVVRVRASARELC